MIYFVQSLSLKVRFAVVVLTLFPVVAAWHLLTGVPWALARLQLASGGVGIPDSAWFYTPDELQRWFQAWGEVGREVYTQVLWPTDAALALAYAGFFAAFFLYLLKKANPRGPWWYLAPLVPVAAAAFDLIEDAAVVAAAWLPSTGWEAVSWIAAGATAAKWSALALTGLALGLGLVGLTVARAVAAWRGPSDESS